MKRKAVFLGLIIMMDILLFGNVFLLLRRYYGKSGTGEKAVHRMEKQMAEKQPERVRITERLTEVSADAADGDKMLALTFDDGPSARYTETLLDGLKKRNIKASFFLVGENIAGNEAIVKRMGEEGHLIGTHCYSHVDLTKKGLQKACEDIIRTNDLIEEITGKRPEYIRPPYGIWNDDLEECVNMMPVFWDIDTLDWKNQNPQRIVRHIQKNAGKHQVILLHDVFKTSVQAALSAIDTMTQQGYTFVTVDELLID